MWLISQLGENRTLNPTWVQEDGAKDHFALQVHDFLGENFSDRWFGMVLQHLQPD